MFKILIFMLLGAGLARWWQARRVARCPRCREALPPRAAFCGRCGHGLPGSGPVIDVSARGG